MTQPDDHLRALISSSRARDQQAARRIFGHREPQEVPPDPPAEAQEMLAAAIEETDQEGNP